MTSFMFFSRNMQYIDKHNHESFFTIDKTPEKLNKKKTLLEYFHNYMSENLLKVSLALTFTLLRISMLRLGPNVVTISPPV